MEYMILGIMFIIEVVWVYKVSKLVVDQNVSPWFMVFTVINLLIATMGVAFMLLLLV